MNPINLARTITNKRREKGLTQEDLASFVGVTKASVSKWETGQSYPDITLLPQLASFFNISIDELMGYEPQMLDEDIRKLYKELAIEFTIKPFDEIVARCRDITKKYFSCYHLLLQMGLLYINYGYYTVPGLDEEQKEAIVIEAKELFLRIKEQSHDGELIHLATHLIATCDLILGNPEDVIDLFQNKSITHHLGDDALLSQAYLMVGKVKEAKKELQNSLFVDIIGLIGVVPLYLNICADDSVHFDEICTRTLETSRIWNIDNLTPGATLPFYLEAATGYMAFDSTEKALAMLEKYTDLVTGDMFTFEVKRDAFFNLISLPTDDIPFAIAEMPRDEKSIKQSIVDGMANNPALAPLQENQQFVNMVRRLKAKLLGHS